MRSVSTTLIALLVAVLSMGAQQRFELSSGTELEVREINASFIDPHSMALDATGVIWATDRITGHIWRINPNGISTIAATIPLRTDPLNEAIRGGLFGIALEHGLYSGSPFVYVSYTEPSNELVIARMELDNGMLGAPETIKRIPGVPCRNGHSMTMLLDGTLMISVGSWDNSDPSSPGRITGKVIRMNVDGTAPKDNPYYDEEYPNRPTGYVYVFGQRQTAGFTQVPADHANLAGAIYSVEPGALSFDEINRVEPGADYGWHKSAGFCKGFTVSTKCPEVTFKHTPSSIAYYGSDAIPEWKNSLLVGTITYDGLMVAQLSSDGRVSNIDATRPADDVIMLSDDQLMPFAYNSLVEKVRDVKVAADGRIYVALAAIGEEQRGRVVALENPAVHSPLGVDEFEMQHNGFKAGPNPFNETINVTLEEPFTKTWNLRVVDMLGSTVHTQQFDKGVTQISVASSQLVGGAYILYLSDGVATRSTTLVK